MVNQDIFPKNTDHEAKVVAVDMVAVALTVNVTTVVSKTIKGLTAGNSKKIKIKGLTDIRLIQKLVQQQFTVVIVL